MTPRQIEILQHSLGVDQYGRGEMFRNHFVTSYESEDGNTCLGLAKLGYMTQHYASDLTGGMPLFLVTTVGKKAMLEQSPKPPKLSKSQQRYLRYLSVSDCFGFTFREFLDWEKENRGVT